MSLKPYAMLVDDDQDFCKILQVVLGKLGVELGIFKNADQFFEALRTRKPGIAMIDLNLDEIGKGFKVLEKFRTSYGDAIPVFIISGSSSTQAIAHAMEVGANDFILKPVDKELLANKLSRYIKSTPLDDFVESVTYEVPTEDRTSALECMLDLEAIDEFGVRLVGPHLISKGTAIRLSGPIFEEVSGNAKSLLMTVASTWVSEDGSSHGAYAEFDSQNTELLANVRRWLSDKLK